MTALQSLGWLARRTDRSLLDDVTREWVPPGIAATVLTLGLASAILDSLTLIAFVPLVHSLIGTSGSDWTRWEPLLWLDRQGTLTILIILCVLVVTKNACGLAHTYIVKQFEGRAAHAVRHRILDLTLVSSIERSGDHDQADILTILSDSSWKVAAASAHLLELIASGSACIVLLTTMMLISPTLTALAALLLGLAALALRIAAGLADKRGRDVVEENKALGNRMLENLTGLQLIRTFGNERFEIDRFAQASESLRKRLLKLQLLWTIPGAITEVAIVIVVSLVIVTGIALGMEVAVLVAFLSLLYRLQYPLRNVIENRLARDGLRGSIEDVRRFLNQAERPKIQSGSIPITGVVRGIRFENVWFRYDDDGPWALQDVSFTIAAGDMTGIVGGSGAGKTTIMMLLYRFVDPTFGSITVDGEPLVNLDLLAWRRQLGLMTQEVHLLGASLADNIRYGRLTATPDDIEHAAHVAGLDEVVRALPAGFDSPVGNTGFRLSGGQRQRVALARVILRNPAVLLLDEATNALDAEAEAHVKLALDAFGSGRTVVAIAHRLASLSAADTIIVLDRGKVLEIGAPDQLLAQQGRFAELYGLQSAPWRSDPR